jgi:hypothetical protein
MKRIIVPVPKKTRRVARLAPPLKASTGQALPDRRAMDGYLAAITDSGRDEALSKAQDIMYDAWDRATSRSRIGLN